MLIDTPLHFDTRSGLYGFDVPGWSLRNVDAVVKLTDGRTLQASKCLLHRIEFSKFRDQLGRWERVVVHNTSPGRPELRQTFWTYLNRPEAIVQLQVISDTPVATNYMAPICTSTPIGGPKALQSLFVPYDNDMYVRYSSNAWSEPAGSCEVGAVYDDASRNGMVVGSIDHDTWKSAVRFNKGAGLTAWAGATSKYSHDSQPHGAISGKILSSPRFEIGCYRDWRQGLERYGDLNALVQPALKWPGPVPFGWSSWSGHKTKLSAADGRAAIDFFHDEIPKFRGGGTAFINLDSFWDNLKPQEIAEFVKHAHALGLKAGIYYTPFTAWGNLSDKVAGSSYHYMDLALKDANGQPVPKIDGGWPLDPTHPGSIERADRQIQAFVKLGFDFLKLDFMTDAALEGHHADPKVATGSQAYAFGMRHIAEELSPAKVGRPFFVCLSIAPLFPSGTAHSRRVSCDVFANIGATEYLLNSANYGWWINDRIYRFNDPDSSCIYQPLGEPVVSMAEARSRLTASVVVGGMLIEGDNLTIPAARERVKQLYTNEALLNIARREQAFRPVNGNTGSKAGDAFVSVDPGGRVAYVAVFNFDKTRPASKSIPFARLGLSGTARWLVREIWTGAVRSASGTLSVNLAPMDCGLLRLSCR